MSGNARITSHVLAFLLCLALACEDSRGATGTRAKPVTSRTQAIARASAYTGLAADRAATAIRKRVTDHSAQVNDISARLVWEVAFTDVPLSAAHPSGEKERNPTVHSIRVWIDAKTGALVQAFTPHPSEGGLVRMLGHSQRAALAGNGKSLRDSPVIPAKSLKAALASVTGRLPKAIPQATEIRAYFGLFTDRFSVEKKVVDRPTWIIYLGGVNLPFSSSGPPGHTGPPPIATECLVMLDAETGASYGEWLTGRLER